MSPTRADPYVAPEGGPRPVEPMEGGASAPSGWPPPVYVHRAEVGEDPVPEVTAAVEAGAPDASESLGERIRVHIGATGQGGAEITRLFGSPDLLERATEAFVREAARRDVDAVVGLEPEGFMLGPLVARALRVPFVPAHRSVAPSGVGLPEGPTPGDRGGERDPYVLAGDEMREGLRCFLVDGRLAGGDTLEAVFRIVREHGGVVVGVGAVTDRPDEEGGYMVDDHNLLVLTNLR